MKESLRKAGYKYEKYLGQGQHLLKEISSNKLEVFSSNKNHSSWGLIWKNTHLEFIRSVN